MGGQAALTECREVCKTAEHKKERLSVKVNNYTLDRFEADYAIFLKRPNETEQLLIHRDDIHVPVKEGDIVSIKDDGESYEIEVLAEETKAAKDRVRNLLDQLRQK